MISEKNFALIVNSLKEDCETKHRIESALGGELGPKAWLLFDNLVTYVAEEIAGKDLDSVDRIMEGIIDYCCAPEPPVDYPTAEKLYELATSYVLKE